MKHLKSFESLFFNQTYFAHPINTYGTPLESECIQIIINSLGTKVLNPGDPFQVDDFKKFRQQNPVDYMKYFKNLIQDCDNLAYLAFPDGMIGAGIVYEAKMMDRKGGEIYEIDTDNNTLLKVDLNRVLEKELSIEETRTRIRMPFK